MSFFKRFAEITGKELPSPDSLSLDEKCALTHQLRLSGESMVAISKYLKVSRQTAYSYYNKAKDGRLSELENKTYLDIFVDRLHELEAQRDVYRKEVQNIKDQAAEAAAEKGSDLDEITTTHLRNIAEIGRLIFQYDKLILDLEYAVGLIPKNNPDSIYGKVSDRNPDRFDRDKDLVEMNDAELSQLLLDKLTRKTPPLDSGNALKNIANERIL